MYMQGLKVRVNNKAGIRIHRQLGQLIPRDKTQTQHHRKVTADQYGVLIPLSILKTLSGRIRSGLAHVGGRFPLARPKIAARGEVWVSGIQVRSAGSRC